MIEIANIQQSTPFDPAKIQAAIHSAASLLPRQGPITKFAFLNPLQGLEHRHYDDVMNEVGQLYGNEAYLDDERYRRELARGRIQTSDLRDVLQEDLRDQASASVGGLTSKLELRLAMLVHPLHFGHRRELDWVLAETDSLRRFRCEVLTDIKQSLVDDFREWLTKKPNKLARTLISELDIESVVDAGAHGNNVWEPLYLKSLWQIIRQAITRRPGESIDTQCGDGELRSHDTASRIAASRIATSNPRVDEMMIRFTSAYLDQGYAPRALPHTDQGYWSSFTDLYRRASRFAPRWHRELAKELSRIAEQQLSPLDVIGELLTKLDVDPNFGEEFLCGTLLSLRGFAGMIWQTETRPDLFPKPSTPGTLVEFTAVRLLLLGVANQHASDVTLGGVATHADAVRAAHWDRPDSEQLAFLIFELAQVLAWSPRRMIAMTSQQWADLVEEVSAFGDHQRRRIFHAAMERRLAKVALNAFAARANRPAIRPEKASLQIVCCIDAREESLRRHLEEIDATVETFGIAGFFSVPMYYRGLGDAGFSALCPIVIKPEHWVMEEAVFSLEDATRTRARARRFVGTAQKRLHAESRRSIGGAIVSTLVGPLATIPMLSRILFPAITARMNRTASQFIAPPRITRLHLEREPESPAGAPRFARRATDAVDPRLDPVIPSTSPINDDGVGFTLDEMTRMAERALRDIGLTSHFAPLVILLGHGSGCLNNPHESSYHCGACAGNAGGPNARALAVMLNDHRVRRCLMQTGIAIPDSTYFLGGQHNTATEEIMFFDLELVPPAKIKHLRAAKELLAEATRRNAHERCRRFESAPLDMSPQLALLHVQNRSEDLAQTRPEYGNGSNALCYVGRRSRIRGLYLDRRAFMMSYDATQDTDDSQILARILAAVVPVCEGINLLYSLSAIDPSGWGSGTKLPHNVTSLIGVMDGAASDLRTGLPWQGVDIHEPVRLLFIIEASPQAIERVMRENPTIDRIFRNHWSHLATLDPHTGVVYRFSKDRFVVHTPDRTDASGDSIPMVSSSIEWYRGKREHLAFAITTPISSPSQTDSPAHGQASLAPVAHSASSEKHAS